MWSLKLNPEDIIAISYEDLNLPVSFNAFRPILFKDGDMFCCLLGPNLQEGIFSFGITVNSAIALWDLAFKKRLLKNSKKDPTARFIAYKINMSRKLHTS